MKKISVCGLLMLFAGMAVAASGDVGQGGLDNWRKAISTNDFLETLAAVATLPDDWPAVRSVRHAGEKSRNADPQQAELRSLAKTFWLGLERYEKTLRDLPPEPFCREAEALLKVRGRFLKHPSYINFFLADAISRVVYVNLAERLAKAGDVPACYDPLVGRLAESRFDLPQIIPVINDEFGTNLISMSDIKRKPLVEQLQTIGKTIGQENFFFYIEDIHNTFGARILGKRSFSALLNRLVMSDGIIGAGLPALLSYRRRSPRSTPDDTYQQIKAVLGEAPAMPPTLLNGNPLPSIEANTLLNVIRSGKWRKELCFSCSHTLSPRRIEELEQQEAEREMPEQQEEQRRQKAANATTP